MTTRHAACSCGQLHLMVEGEPSTLPCAHLLLECQRRTGAAISNQARFNRPQITIVGRSTEWTRTAESGNVLTYNFCPICGSTVYWKNTGYPDLIAIAIGAFADPNFPQPTISVWEECRHPWLPPPFDRTIKLVAKQG